MTTVELPAELAAQFDPNHVSREVYASSRWSFFAKKEFRWGARRNSAKCRWRRSWILLPAMEFPRCTPLSRNWKKSENRSSASARESCRRFFAADSPCVYVSEQVYAEVVVNGAGQPGASDVAEANWIEVNAIEQPDDLATARRRFGLGLGELATIILAKEIGAPLVLMDDTRGRRIALSEGLEVRGAVGIVESLFRRGELPDLRSAFEQLLRAQAYLDRNILNLRLTVLGLRPL